MPVDSKKLVPKLRFPEFTDEWQAKKLGNVSVFYDQKRIPVESADRQKMQGAYPYYGASGVIDYIDEYIFDGEYILLAEDGANILMRSSPVAFLAKGKFWVNNHAHVLRAKGSNGFLVAYLENLRYEKYNTGTAQPKLNVEICKNIEIVLPGEKEQQKIADFLTVVDKKIESINKKIELLKQYKKAVMQKIFKQKLRFTDNGTSYPDWTTEKAGDLFNNISDRDRTGTLPVLSVTQDAGVVLRRSLDRKIDSSAGSKNYKIIQPGDFVISLRSFQGGLELSKIKGASSPAYTVIRGKSMIVPEMYKHYFKRDVFISMLSEAVIGIRDGKQISYSAFASLKLPVPAKDEQQKIADLLDTIDASIDAEVKRLECANEFKKVLLRGMFS